MDLTGYGCWKGGRGDPGGHGQAGGSGGAEWEIMNQGIWGRTPTSGGAGSGKDPPGLCPPGPGWARRSGLCAVRAASEACLCSETPSSRPDWEVVGSSQGENPVIL